MLHAAAHKHVALMEDGTYILAKTAAAYNVERFLFISTDKAVRPGSVMGASKRLGGGAALACGAELYQVHVGAVRVGRLMSIAPVRHWHSLVLGSSGSVVKIFQEQIQAGGLWPSGRLAV